MSPAEARWSLGAVATLVGGTLEPAAGSTAAEAGAALVTGVAGLSDAGEAHVSFFANRSYARQLAATKALAVIVAPGDAAHPGLQAKHRIVRDHPYAAFAKVSAAFHPEPVRPAGIDPQARVEAGAEVHASARVEQFATISKGSVLGPRVVVMAGAFVGEGVRVGEGTVLWPNVVVREGCSIGARCVLHPGAVVGADGFGFAFDPEGDGNGPMHRKVPQVGTVVLEDDVELGANTCVDRATLGETRIGAGTKLDNLVQVAHNVRIGPLGVVAGQAGIAGSATIGTGVAIGGQAGVVGHITVGDLVKVGAKAGVMQDTGDGVTLQGMPAHELADWRREATAQRRLPALLKQVRQLEERLEALERGAGK